MKNPTDNEEEELNPSSKNNTSTLVIDRDDIMDFIQHHREKYEFLQPLTDMDEDVLPAYSKLYQSKKRREKKSVENKTGQKKKVKTEEPTLPRGALGLESDSCTRKVLGQIVSDSCTGTVGVMEVIQDEEEYD